MAAAVINSLQVLVSRCISPLDNGVLTIGTICGGTAGNIVAGEVEMTGTLRTTDRMVRQNIIDTMTRMVKCTCQAMGGNGEVTVTPGYAALINTDQVVDVLVETASDIIGEEHIHWKKCPSMGVEDFHFSWTRPRVSFIIWAAPAEGKRSRRPFTARTLIWMKPVSSWGLKCRPGWPCGCWKER